MERRTEFRSTVTKQFTDYCKSKEVNPSIEYFAEYLINRNLIIDKTITRFLVIDKYPEALHGNMAIKQQAIYQLEEEIGVSESTIKRILNRFSKAFRLQSRVIPKNDLTGF
jgi:hypothetical protein